MKLKGITVGTYISKRPKGKFDESICASCVNNKNKNIDKKKQYGLYEEASINSALKRAGLKLGIGLYEEVNSKGKKVTRTDIHTHMLRGTFATRCAEAKIAPVVLKEILGHSDISITMKYYIDIDTDFIKAENKSVVNYLINKNIFGVIMNKDNMDS